MPSADSKQPRGSRSGLVLLIVIVFGLAAFFGYKYAHPQPANPQPVAVANHKATKEPAPAPPPVAKATVSASATTQTAAPGTIISPEEVFTKVDKWMAEHPTYHLKTMTAFPNGNVTGNLNVYAYSNAVDGSVTAIDGILYNPAAIHFITVKRAGTVKTYFPASEQLVEQDVAKTLAQVPTLAGASGYKGLMKLSKHNFAEASADLMVATVTLNTQDLKMGDLPSEDIFLSVRANNQGKVLGLEEQVGGGRSLTSFEYVTFDPATVAKEAPRLPSDRLTLTNKTFEQAMQDEIRLVSKKPFGKKI